MTDTRAEEHDLAPASLDGAHAATLQALSERRHRVKVPKRPSTLRSLVEWVLVLGGALLVALLIRTFLFATFWIPSASMEPTLMGHPGRNDRVIVNKLSYRLHEVHRGDIVVFSKPDSEATITEGGREVKDLIKRVIGLENETVSIRDGDVLVDGEILDEDYLTPGTETTPCSGDTQGGVDEVIEVPEDSVLVMGDNRGNSKDGRCFGPIEESSIVGRAFVRIWPLTEFGSL